MTAITPKQPPHLAATPPRRCALALCAALLALASGCSQGAQDGQGAEIANTEGDASDIDTNTREIPDDDNDEVDVDVEDDCLGCFPTLAGSMLATSNFCGGWAVMSAGGYTHASLSAAALLSAGQSASADGAYLLRSGPTQLFLSVSDPAPATCGDGVVGGLELCDAADTGGRVCENLGFAGGALGCAPDCQAYDVSACLTDAQLCAAGRLSPSRGWECDSGASASACAALGFDGQASLATALTCDSLCQWDALPCGFDPLGGVNAGAQHACALSTDTGEVTCWGDDSAQQSSAYDGAGQRHPALSAVYPGGGFTCGVRLDNGLTHCWGDDLPNCALPDCDPSEPLFALRATQDAYCGVNASGQARCAVTTGGAPIPLAAWTRPPASLVDVDLSARYVCGMFRQSSLLTVSCVERAATLPRQGDVTLVAYSLAQTFLAIGDNSLCLLDLGEVRCATITAESTALLLVDSVSTGVSYAFTALDVHGDTACGYSDNFESGVYCWDATQAPTAANAPSPFLGVDLSDAPSVYALTMGDDFLCLDTSLGVRCAARPVAGALPRSGAALAPDAKVLAASLAPTSGTGCALVYDPRLDAGASSVQPMCWGDASGMPAISPMSWRGLSVLDPSHMCFLDASGAVVCAMGEGAAPLWRTDLALTQVTLSLGMGCGLTAQGEPRCWGADGADLSAGPSALPGDVRFAKLSLSSNGSWCGILAGGEVEGVGPLRCSDDIVTNYGVGAPGGRSYFRDFSLTDDYLCAVTSSGWLSCWGAGKPSDAPPNISDGSSFKQVVTALGFACGLRLSGEVACWGDVPPEAAVSARLNVAVDSLTAGQRGVCAHRRNGELACWGEVGLGYR